MEIQNAFALVTFFRTFQNVVIAMVVAEPALSARAPEFREVLHSLANSFRSDIERDAFCQSTCVVVTKTRDLTNPTDVKDLIRENIMNPLRREGLLPPTTETLLGGLLAHSKIALLPYPTQPGRFVVSEDERSSIFDTVQQTPAAQVLSPELTLSAEAKEIALQAGRRLWEQIHSVEIVVVVSAITNYFETLIQQDILPARQHREIFLEFTRRFPTTSAVEDFLQAVGQTLQGTGIPFETLDQKVQLLLFLKKCNQEAVLPLDRWFSTLARAKTAAEQLSVQPTSNNVGGILHVQGVIIGTSDINQIIDQNRGAGAATVTQVRVSCSKLAIDSDIISRGTSSSPTLSLAMTASVAIVVGDRLFDLRGAEGQDGADGRLPGESGQPGGPGGTGGSLKIIARTFRRFNHLRIDTSGGNGGRGGNGMHGAPGLNGKDGDLNKRTGEDTFNPPSGRYYSEIGRWYYRDPGSAGGEGQNGGMRGAGGIPGIPGRVTIRNEVIQT